MPIFRIKSVKIYTGQKNLHWRRQWRQWQLSGMLYLNVTQQNFIVNSVQAEYCTTFIVFISPSQAWHINFSQWFQGLNHENHLYPECISFRPTNLTTLTTWPPCPPCPPRPSWSPQPTWLPPPPTPPDYSDHSDQSQFSDHHPDHLTKATQINKFA